MNKLKTTIVAVLAVFFVLIFLLPSGKENLLQAELERMPEYNFLQEAERLWSENDKEEALAVLDIAADNNLPQAVEAEEKKGVYLKKIFKAKNPMAKLQAHGRSLAPQASSWQKLAQTGVTVFFTEEDTSTLTRSGKASPFVKDIREIAKLSELWSQAGYAVPLLITSAKQKVLSPSTLKELSRSTKQIKNSRKLNTNSVRQVLNKVMPLWELASQCDTWSQWATFAKIAETPQQMSMLMSIFAADPTAKRKLEQILTLMEVSPTDVPLVLGYVNDYGIKGVNQLYEAVRKGPKGLVFVAAHPDFSPEPLIGARPLITGRFILKWWLSGLLNFPFTAQILRYLLLWGLGSMIIISIVPNKKVIHGCVLTAVLLFIVFLFNHLSEPSSAPKVGNATSGMTTVASGTAAGTQATAMTTQASSVSQNLSGLSLLILLTIIFIQFAISLRAISEVKKIRESRATFEGKLRQIDNVDIFFDLPLYLGLLGTVTAFVIIVFDPGASRLVAYTSTIVGIIISALLRVFQLYPFRREILMHIDQFNKAKLTNGQA